MTVTNEIKNGRPATLTAENNSHSMKRKIIFISLIISIFNTLLYTSIAQPYSQSPVRIPLYFAGGFAEIRPNHFHSGLDIKTGGKEGERIYAPSDGYVSRINISAWGVAKVL